MKACLEKNKYGLFIIRRLVFYAELNFFKIDPRVNQRVG